MKNYMIIICTVFLTYTVGFSHNPNEAFFVVSTFDGIVEIEAEFPWSIRNALLDYRPELNQEQEKSKFEQALFDYIQDYLKLTDEEGNAMNLRDIKFLDHQGHAHQNRVLLTYNGSRLKTIQNRIMFNIYENQINYHKLEDKGNELIPLTYGKDTIQLLQDSDKKYKFFGYLSFIFIIAAIIIRRINNNSSQLELKC